MRNGVLHKWLGSDARSGLGRGEGSGFRSRLRGGGDAERSRLRGGGDAERSRLRSGLRSRLLDASRIGVALAVVMVLLLLPLGGTGGSGVFNGTVLTAEASSVLPPDYSLPGWPGAKYPPPSKPGKPGGGGGGGSGGGGNPSGVPITWAQVFNMLPGVTYTYKLEYSTIPDRGWPAPGRGNRIQGELNMTRVGGKDEIQFSFNVGGVRGGGTVPYDIHALAGGVFVAAMTSPKTPSLEALQLLATPFYWVEWYDLFTKSNFRNGLVWQTYDNPPYRFNATSVNGWWSYNGRLTRGRDVVMDLAIDVHDPWPSEITVYGERSQFKAVLSHGVGRR